MDVGVVEAACRVRRQVDGLAKLKRHIILPLE
jgi:hypothetical protein